MDCELCPLGLVPLQLAGPELQRFGSLLRLDVKRVSCAKFSPFGFSIFVDQSKSALTRGFEPSNLLLSGSYPRFPTASPPWPRWMLAERISYGLVVSSPRVMICSLQRCPCLLTRWLFVSSISSSFRFFPLDAGCAHVRRMCAGHMIIVAKFAIRPFPARNRAHHERWRHSVLPVGG